MVRVNFLTGLGLPKKFPRSSKASSTTLHSTLCSGYCSWLSRAGFLSLSFGTNDTRQTVRERKAGNREHFRSFYFMDTHCHWASFAADEWSLLQLFGSPKRTVLWGFARLSTTFFLNVRIGVHCIMSPRKCCTTDLADYGQLRACIVALILLCG